LPARPRRIHRSHADHLAGCGAGFNHHNLLAHLGTYSRHGSSAIKDICVFHDDWRLRHRRLNERGINDLRPQRRMFRRASTEQYGQQPRRR
jgi:hypothetical protein